jgi:hypothetical protein
MNNSNLIELTLERQDTKFKINTKFIVTIMPHILEGFAGSKSVVSKTATDIETSTGHSYIVKGSYDEINKLIDNVNYLQINYKKEINL